MRRGTSSAVALACSLVVVGCADDPEPGRPIGSPTATASTAPSVAPTAAAPFTADTEPDTATASGGLLGMRVARAAAQPGYDRVVLELQGSGLPGWRVSYVDRPVADGSGDPVAVRGSAFLEVVVTGVGYPMDTGVPEPAPRRFRPGTPNVQEVVLTGVFEGQYTAFVGVGSRQPFRVFRLSSPPRVVLDVRVP